MLKVLKADAELKQVELIQLIKLSWSFVVFSSQHLSKNRRLDETASDLGTGLSNVGKLSDEERVLAYDNQLWTSVIDVLERKLELLSQAKALVTDVDSSSDSGTGLPFSAFEKLNQIKCHIKLHGNKLGLKRAFKNDLPSNLQIGGDVAGPLASSDGRLFKSLLKGSLQQLAVHTDGIVDFYHIVGMVAGDEGTDRKLIVVNKPDQFFLDARLYNSWHRLRADHFGILMGQSAASSESKRVIELDFYEFE